MSDLAEAYVKRQLTLLRSAEGDAQDIARAIERIHNRVLAYVSRGNLSLEEIKAEVERQLSSFYFDAWPEELKVIAAEVVTAEVNWNNKTLLGPAASEALEGDITRVLTKADKRTFKGHRIQYWLKNQYKNESKAIKRILDTGYRDGDTIDDMTGKMQQVMKIKKNEAKTIARAHFMLHADAAKESVVDDNVDLIEALVWSSTLDARTTPLICGVRDQKEYDPKTKEPIGHSYPWNAGPGMIHWNCRSAWRPKVKGVDDETPRKSVDAGSKYERGDNKTRTGRIRKYSKAAREKKFYKLTTRDTRSNYERWLKEQADKNIDYVADILGSKKKAVAFQSGQKTLKQLGKESPVANPINRKKL